MKTVMLSVGISDYASPQIDDLSACKDDASRMLQTWQALAGGNFAGKLLVDAEATRQGIEAGVRWLAETAAPGDLAVFYYSGHGASFEDDESDEADRKDEFLCPHDCGIDKGIDSFIRDDDLRAWLAAVNQKTDKLVLIFDSCHSGTANMAPVQAQAKEIPPDVVRQLIGDSKAAQPKSAPAASVANQVLLAGCQDYQQSYILNGHEHSLFTASLLKALEDGSVTTIQGLFQAAAQLAQDEADMANIQQSPNLVDGTAGELAFR